MSTSNNFDFDRSQSGQPVRAFPVIAGQHYLSVKKSGRLCLKNNSVLPPEKSVKSNKKTGAPGSNPEKKCGWSPYCTVIPHNTNPIPVTKSIISH